MNFMIKAKSTVETKLTINLDFMKKLYIGQSTD